MKKIPILSVCIITYNHAKYIRESLDTILSQQVNFEWQLIVADDCSTDGTAKILKDYQKNYPELIKLILQPKNVGPEENWLTLMSVPKTKYVLYGEGDDYFTDNSKLQKQVDFLERHAEYSICFHPVKVIYEDGSHKDDIFPAPEQRFKKEKLTLEDLLKKNFMQTNSVMYRWRFVKEDVKKSFPRGISPGDWLMHILHADKGSIGYLNETMSVYRKHEGGLWWSAEKALDAHFLKHSESMLNLYFHCYLMFGENKKYSEIIFKNYYEMLNKLSSLSKDQSSSVYADYLSRHGEWSKITILSFENKIKQILDRQKEYEDYIVNLESQVKDLKVDLQSANDTIVDIKRSRGYIYGRKATIIYRKIMNKKF